MGALLTCEGVAGANGVPVVWSTGGFAQNWKHLPTYPQKPPLGAAPVVGLGVWVAICAEAKPTAINATAAKATKAITILVFTIFIIILQYGHGLV
jgi:hypothetical protein